MKSLLAGLVLAPSVVLSVALGVGVASPASALSCVGPRLVLGEAKAIYAGRIVASDDHEVTLEVDEVWRGTPPPKRATFEVELPQWWEFDGAEERGEQVVVAPADGAVNPCTVFALTGPMAKDVRSFRPASPASPASPALPAEPRSTVIDEDAPAQSALPAWAWATGGAVALLVAGGVVGVVRRRRA